MKSYFYKINSVFIQDFIKRVFDRFNNEDIKTDSIFIRSILQEVNKLFKFIGGRISSKSDIPKPTDYPDSEQFNRLITNISTDIQRVFTIQKLVEDDINNLLNYNAAQRTKAYENLTSSQQNIYSMYVKNKTLIDGGIIVPAENPFVSSDNKSGSSTGIYIDQTRQILTLDSQTTTVKPVDINNVQVLFTNTLPDTKIYPDNIALHLGSHWKIPSVAQHFVNTNNLSDTITYRQMMIDDPNSNTGIGWCEFEGVLTTDFVQNANDLVPTLKQYIGQKYNKDSQLIYLDKKNSLQGDYITSANPIQGQPQYKLVVPFTNDVPITNEIIIDFEPDYIGYYPSVIWDKSKIYSSQGVYNLSVSPSTQDGRYSCTIKDGFIKPSRIELILEYGADNIHWILFDYYMSHYVYNLSQNYTLTQNDGSSVTLILNKSYDIFVDTEADTDSELNRAYNVLNSWSS